MFDFVVMHYSNRYPNIPSTEVLLITTGCFFTCFKKFVRVRVKTNDLGLSSMIALVIYFGKLIT